jgi:protein-S-isoprenylcysteine O-methyltransferase Ste14
MTRGFYLLFAFVTYLIFFASFLYLIGFVADLPALPRTVNRGGAAGAMSLAAVVDAGLILLFGLQHSIMARQGFKRGWTRIVPAPIERSVYVLATSIVLILLFALWRPIPAEVWRVDGAAGRAVLWGLCGAGWVIVLVSTFLIDHFELFGLRQVYLHARDRAAEAPRLRTPFLYKLVRHPLYVGFLLAFWATPAMSQGHLLLALGVSIYMLVGIRYEERDLVAQFGGDYEDYRREVGMLIPRPRRRA